MTALFGAIPHAAAVHIPLALAVLFPGFYWASWWTTHKRLMPERIWTALWILAAVQLGTIGMALASGESAEFLSAGSHAQIEQHEHFAVSFAVAWALTFLTLSLALWKTNLRTTLFHSLVSGLLLAQFLLAVWTGHIGGGLMN
jgi:hypothetical protein